MEDPTVIATLVADDSRLTQDAFQLAHNHLRYTAPLADHRPLGSVPGTPLRLEEDDEQDIQRDEDAHQLLLSFDHPPKDPRQGFVFGWHPNCDILIADREKWPDGNRDKVRRVNDRHFSITFDQHGRVILRAFERPGVIVSYDDQANKEDRSHFTWIIFPQFKSIQVRLPGTGICFNLRLPKHGASRPQYIDNVRAFLQQAQAGTRNISADLTSNSTATPSLATPMNRLGMHSASSSAASTPRSSKTGPIRIKLGKIGQGGFGVVYKFLDASTGQTLAGKEFSDDTWQNEILAMQRLRHDHIVKFVDFQNEPVPQLMMEYLPEGDLLHQSEVAEFQYEESVTIVMQTLDALAYLHENNFAHRDIKPQNILVASRRPSIVVKLTDFGLSKDNQNGVTQLRSNLGTSRYVAPEVLGGSPYTPSVDIWSLGIMAFDLFYGFTPVEHLHEEHLDYKTWHETVLNDIHKPKLSESGLLYVIREHMLRVMPYDRLDARGCREKLASLSHQTPVQENCGRSGLAGTLPGVPTIRGPVEPEVIPGPSNQRPDLHRNGSKRRLPAHDTTHERDQKRFLASDGKTTPAAVVSAEPSHFTISPCRPGQYSTRIGEILELLQFLRGRKVQDFGWDPDTAERVAELSRQLSRHGVSEVTVSRELMPRRTVLSAPSGMVLATIYEVDIQRSVAELATHVSNYMDDVQGTRAESRSRSHSKALPIPPAGDEGLENEAPSNRTLTGELAVLRSFHMGLGIAQPLQSSTAQAFPSQDNAAGISGGRTTKASSYYTATSRISTNSKAAKLQRAVPGTSRGSTPGPSNYRTALAKARESTRSRTQSRQSLAAANWETDLSGASLDQTAFPGSMQDLLQQDLDQQAAAASSHQTDSLTAPANTVPTAIVQQPPLQQAPYQHIPAQQVPVQQAPNQQTGVVAQLELSWSSITTDSSYEANGVTFPEDLRDVAELSGCRPPEYR